MKAEIKDWGQFVAVILLITVLSVLLYSLMVGLQISGFLSKPVSEMTMNELFLILIILGWHFKR